MSFKQSIMQFSVSIAAGLLIAVASHFIAAHASLAADTVYPQESWTTKPPADVGLDPRVLDDFSRYVEGFGCVVRHGYLAYGWGQIDRRKDVASCCKPWFTHFLFEALEQGKIKSLDDAIAALEPRLAPLNADLAHKDRQITWRHLANQISCYGVTEKPGEAFDYSGADFREWCSEAGFKHFEVIHLAGPSSAAIAYK